MSELIDLVPGPHDVRAEGFEPGGASLRRARVPHGHDAEASVKASSALLAPHKLSNTLAFMFESRVR